MTYETQTCPKCRGTGAVKSVVDFARCWSCNATGRVLTAASKRIKKAREERAAQVLGIPAAQVTVGMKIRLHSSEKFRTVASISPNCLRTRIGFLMDNGLMEEVANEGTVQRYPTKAELTAILEG